MASKRSVSRHTSVATQLLCNMTRDPIKHFDISKATTAFPEKTNRRKNRNDTLHQ